MLKRAALALLLVGASLHAQEAVVLPGFEVATVKPAKGGGHENWNVDSNWTRIENAKMVDLIRDSYGLGTDAQVVDGPDWLRTERFDVAAKVGEAEYARESKLTGKAGEEAYQGLMQSFLKERFGLVVVRETRKEPIHALLLQGTAASTALRPTALGPDGTPLHGRHSMGRMGSFECSGVTMEDLAGMLSNKFELEQLWVHDETGLKGYYDFSRKYAPDRGKGVAADATDPGLVDALREQLGLRVKKQVGDVPVVVVKELRRPDFD